jgi:hypothetical protein
MKLTGNEATAFASTFYFFSSHKTPAEKNKKSLQATAPNNTDNNASLQRQNNGRTEARTDNKGLKEMEGDLVYQHFYW